MPPAFRWENSHMHCEPVKRTWKQLSVTKVTREEAIPRDTRAVFCSTVALRSTAKSDASLHFAVF
jgi:hypothetical protein